MYCIHYKCLHLQEEDEWSQFFKEDVEPKLLITTQQGRTSQRTKEFVEELQELFPHAEYVKRKNFEMKLVTKYAIKRGLFSYNSSQKAPVNHVGLTVFATLWGLSFYFRDVERWK